LTTDDGVFRGVRDEELKEGTVRRIEGVRSSKKEYDGIQRSNGVQLEVRIVPVECPVGR
jgi:hypothetical protein